MKVLAGLFRWIFILCLPVLLITGSLALAFNTVSLYRYGFEKYHVSEVTGIAPAELDKAAQGLIKKGTVISEGLLNTIEMAFRAYDPCFGCATHTLPGQTPLELIIYNSKGEVAQKLSR